MIDGLVLLVTSMHLYFKVLIYLFVFSLTYGSSSSSQNDEEHGDMSILRQKTDTTTNAAATPDSSNFLTKKIREGQCPTGVECHKLGDPCITCVFNESCIYGAHVKVPCTAQVDCLGEKEFEVDMICRYCYQTDHWEHSCILKGGCNSVSSPRSYYRTNCTVKSDIQCLGRRTFLKNIPCNWTGGYRWSTALILSITLGGFGADRFYLGHWQEGIGKLFSFGGLGVWTLIDVVLIAIHYLGPADGSLYI